MSLSRSVICTFVHSTVCVQCAWFVSTFSRYSPPYLRSTVRHRPLFIFICTSCLAISFNVFLLVYMLLIVLSLIWSIVSGSCALPFTTHSLLFQHTQFGQPSVCIVLGCSKKNIFRSDIKRIHSQIINENL